MVKKVAVINDLSGFGRCSLTAAISAISVMGVQPCPLPTAVLSSQTGYSSYYCDDYTDKMEFFRREWEKMGAEFDGIYTGFLASEAQVDHIFRFLETFYKKNTFLLVDPVMGDGGHTYKMFTGSLLEKMKKLVMQADVITPNLTELCLLTDSDYQKFEKLKEKNELILEIERLGKGLMKNGNSGKGAGTVVVTGIHYLEEAGEERIGNLVIADDGMKFFSYSYIGGSGGSFSGTGDLFASILAGGIARGDDIFSLSDLAAKFLECAMESSVKDGVERNDGTNYEQYLGMLILPEHKWNS